MAQVFAGVGTVLILSAAAKWMIWDKHDVAPAVVAGVVVEGISASTSTCIGKRLRSLSYSTFASNEWAAI
jgi:hypothetical protein